ncbi:MAG: lytic transglycosylase domain-containing protein [Paludibacteraceae bacterium]|nr:lytic transglycosylase domain-containing protein [Paludibacteraceae bacterium]
MHRKLFFLSLFIILNLFANATQTVVSFPIPAKVQFAGQTILLDRYDLRERFDREQTQIAYTHTNSILILKRANRYFPIIEPILKANGIPDDFKYLAVIESNLDTRALSPATAGGLWQLMPATAKEHGLEVSDEVDERYHLEKATEAACKYLKTAFNRYRSWTTAAVSYNAGMGKISSEQQKQYVQEAYDMHLVSESSRYLFRILAMKQFIENPYRLGFRIDREHYYQHINTQKVAVKDSIGDLAKWAQEQGINYAQLKEFNVWLRDRKLSNPKRKEYMIDIPDTGDMIFKSSKIKIHNPLKE